MNFKEALKTNDENFESILEIMKLQRTSEEVDNVRNLLKTTNLILEFFMNREESVLKIPVVYFPICLDYAQELCEDFITIKLGLYSNKNWKNHICSRLSSDVLIVPPEIKTKRQKQLHHDNFIKERKLSKILSSSKNEYVDYDRSFIYSERLQRDYARFQEDNGPHSRSFANRYWYLHHAINESKDSLKGDCPLSLINTDAESFYDHVLNNGENVNIQNIVVFPLGSADGRYSQFCSDLFQKCFIDDFVSSGCGLKNVFFFCFSRKPYRLRRLFDFKQRMLERTQFYGDDAYDFISFTYEESSSWSDTSKTNQKKVYIGKEHNDLQEDFETLFDDLTSGLEKNVCRRNEMALCVNETYNKEYYDNILDETEADENILSQIFNFNRNLWKEDTKCKLSHFLFGRSVCVITGFEINEKLKSEFADLLKDQYQATKVEFGTFPDLRGYQRDGVYKNKISQERILVMSFRNDYTDSIFHKYPNSFDPYCVNSNQLLLEIANYFCLRQYYDWGWYNYGKAIKKILKSDFRAIEMKPMLVENKKPIKRLPDDIHDLEDDRNTIHKVQKIKVVYEGGIHQEFYKSELMLIKVGDILKICPLSDLLDLYESVDVVSLQPLAPLVRRIFNQCVEAKRDIDYRSERMFKEQTIYGLNANEIASETQLWKILLEKHVDKLGCKKVYDNIMENFAERYKVSYHSFKRWIEPDYGIPRAKRVQKFLIEDYLGIRPPYINLIRRIKERTKSDTGEITATIKNFLNIALLNTNFNAVFNALNDETIDLLGIDEPSDIENIITDVKEIIKLEPVKSINYDS